MEVREAERRMYGDLAWTWPIISPPEDYVEEGELLSELLRRRAKTTVTSLLHLGCGGGHLDATLKRHFDVTGVDISPSAVALAQAHAREKGVACRFMVADVLGGLPEITGTFDFAFDWSLLHHVFPEDRRQYVETVHRLLVRDGKYLSVCFSQQDTGFGGTAQFRTTPLGTVLYFSSEDELRDLFTPYFDVRALKTIQVEGKREPHLMNYAFMEKRQR